MSTSDAVAYLRSPRAIRERAEHVLSAGLAGELAHFSVDEAALDPAAERVAEVTRRRYPDLAIPYHSRWNHFRAGGVDRVQELDRRWGDLDRHERARRQIELVVISVLLDAGAGSDWRYREVDTGVTMGRSEGLAIASFHLVTSGRLRGTASSLAEFDEGALADAFQVTGRNPLVGLQGRAELVRRLAGAIGARPELFPGERIGGLYDALRARARGGAIAASDVLGALLEGLATIWPGRIELGGVNLGDVWPHPAAGGHGPGAGLVPFHKLSQWLAYSILEPLEWAGLDVVGVDELTGLPEYRNGGLLVDTGVLVPRHDEVTGRRHRPGGEIVVEWRALTVALLDRLAERVKRQLGPAASQWPTARVLEGGTWAAGRELALERRPAGRPPIALDSDGTVF